MGLPVCAVNAVVEDGGVGALAQRAGQSKALFELCRAPAGDALRSVYVTCSPLWSSRTAAETMTGMLLCGMQHRSEQLAAQTQSISPVVQELLQH